MYKTSSFKYNIFGHFLNSIWFRTFNTLLRTIPVKIKYSIRQLNLSILSLIIISIKIISLDKLIIKWLSEVQIEALHNIS